MTDQKTLIVLGVIVVIVIVGAYYYGTTNVPPPPPPVEKDNVIQTLTKAGNFNTFLQAVQTAGLTTMLQGAGPFTVFAPTDAAFAKIPTSDLNALLADKPRLISLISYHIVNGHFTSSELENPMLTSLSSTQGSNLVLAATKVEKASYVTKNIGVSTSESIVHSIDTVLTVPLRLLTINTLTLGLKNIQPATYEMWVLEGGNMESLGKFTVDSNGYMHTEHFNGGIDNTFHRETGDFADASSFKVSIEAPGDVDRVPSGVYVLDGTVTGGSATSPRVSFNFPVSLSDVIGSFVLATPTDGNNSNELSGAWFFLDQAGTVQGLDLPVLPPDWVYQGWVWIDSEVISGPPGQSGDILNVPITTGRFTSATGWDDSNRYSWPLVTAPQFPGEDFLQDSSTAEGMLLQIPSRSHGYPLMNVTFPLNLADGNSRITITLQPDIEGIDPQGVGPSFITILSADIIAGATDHTPYDLVKDLTSVPTAEGSLTPHD